MTSTFVLKYKFADELVIGASALVNEYMHGIPLTDTSGSVYNIKNIKKKIAFATVQIENFLFIKVIERTVTDLLDYIEEEWRNWASIKTIYPINTLISVKGHIGEQEVLSLTKENWTVQGKNLAWVPGTNALASSVIAGIGGHINSTYYTKTGEKPSFDASLVDTGSGGSVTDYPSPRDTVAGDTTAWKAGATLFATEYTTGATPGVNDSLKIYFNSLTFKPIAETTTGDSIKANSVFTLGCYQHQSATPTMFFAGRIYEVLDYEIIAGNGKVSYTDLKYLFDNLDTIYATAYTP